MPKSSPEKLAKALRANLKKRKIGPSAPPPMAGQGPDPASAVPAGADTPPNASKTS